MHPCICIQAHLHAGSEAACFFDADLKPGADIAGYFKNFCKGRCGNCGLLMQHGPEAANADLMQCVLQSTAPHAGSLATGGTSAQATTQVQSAAASQVRPAGMSV